MWDLVDKVLWLERNQTVAKKIAAAGCKLARELTYERELDNALPVISSAFRYFAGQSESTQPCDRS